MKNKYIYILIIVIISIVSLVIFGISYLNNNFDKNHIIINDDRIGNNNREGEFNDSDKKIDINTKIINPENYDGVNEFINYLYTGPGIKLDVNLLEEDFYINIENSNGTLTYTKFDKELIDDIDRNNDKNYKNHAITDIFTSFKNNKIFGEANNTRSGVRFLKDNELPISSQLHNNILDPFSGKSFITLENDLESIKNRTNEQNNLLSYIYDFKGDYNKSLKLKESLGIEKIKYTVSGTVNDTYGKTLSGAIVSLINNIENYGVTDSNGKYKFSFEIFPLSRLRFRASKEGSYSDAYNSDYILYDNKEQIKEGINFNLQEENFNQIIKYKDLEGDKSIIIKSTLGNTFEFTKGSVVDLEGNVHTSDFIAKIFEFNESTSSMEGFLNNDNFDEVYGYVGNVMKTTGMTYLLLTDIEGKELFISKQNPIKTVQKSNLELMKSDLYDIGYKLTNDQIKIILEESSKGGYPINRDFLLKMNIHGYSPWWVFNIGRGIRENQGIKLINETGLKEGLYYNID